MVSTRHHPRPFPEPATPTSASSSPTTATRTKIPATTTTSSSSPSTTTTRARKAASHALDDPEGVVEDTKNALTTTSAKTAKKARSLVKNYSKESAFVHTPPLALLIWLAVSLPLVVWDTSYVFLRPHSMPGGRFHSPIWAPYALYGTIDYVYGWPAWHAHNGFTAAQAALNTIETLAYAYYLAIVWTNVQATLVRGEAGVRGAMEELWYRGWRVQGPGTGLAVLVCFSSAVMTLSKTVLYWLNEYFSSFENIGHNGWFNLILLWIIPNGLWIVLPAYMIYVLAPEMLAAMDAGGSERTR